MNFWAVTLLLILFEASPRPLQQYEHLLRAADAAYREGRLDETVRLLLQASELHPQAPGLQQLLGARALAAGRLELAADASRKAVNQNPADGNSHWNLGVSLFRLGRIEPSVASLKKAAVRLPKQPDVFQALGLALCHAHEYEAASQVLDKAIALAPDVAEYHYLKGLSESHLPENAKSIAESSYRKALAIDAKHAYANYNLGRLLVETNRVKDAIPLLRTALKESPEITGAYFTLGNALMRTGEIEEGRTLLKTFAALEKDERVKSSLDRLIELRPQDADLRCRRGFILLRQGALRDAMADAKVARQFGSKHQGPWLLTAAIELRRSRGKKALEAADRALEIDGSSLEGKLHRARALLQLKRLKDALKELEPLEEALQDDADFFSLLALVHERLGNDTLAEEAKAKAQALGGGS